MVDLTKLILDSNYNAFKQNAIYPGTETISGTNSAGLNIRTFTVPLTSVPDMVDILFNGPGNLGFDDRPDTGWFKQGAVWVPTDNAGGGSPAQYFLYASITGSTLTITAQYVQTFLLPEQTTPTVFGYRVLDYSVF